MWVLAIWLSLCRWYVRMMTILTQVGFCLYCAIIFQSWSARLFGLDIVSRSMLFEPNSMYLLPSWRHAYASWPHRPIGGFLANPTLSLPWRWYIMSHFKPRTIIFCVLYTWIKYVNQRHAYAFSNSSSRKCVIVAALLISPFWEGNVPLKPEPNPYLCTLYLNIICLNQCQNLNWRARSVLVSVIWLCSDLLSSGSSGMCWSRSGSRLVSSQSCRSRSSLHATLTPHVVRQGHLTVLLRTYWNINN